jgi:hypothetical protein
MVNAVIREVKSRQNQVPGYAINLKSRQLRRFIVRLE